MPRDDSDSSFKPHGAIADLVAAAGTADGTVADVGASFDQATLNDNFQELATRVNEILGALRAGRTIIE